MKSRFLIIIGITIIVSIIALSVGTLEYQSTYNQNCKSDGGKIVGFLKCIYIHEDFALLNPFTVGISFDDTFQYEDLELHFYDIEDSRCPLDVTCVWEGKVTVMIQVKNQTHKIAGYFTPNYTVSYITPYNVTLVDIQPHPISTEKPDYVATLEIKKLDDVKITESDDDSIYGFAIDDTEGNVTHYPIDKLDEIPCHDFMGFWNEEFRTVDEHEILVEKYDTCFEETFGGPGNRHPAFVGYEIPKDCTKDMIKHLVKYSNMFFADEEPFSLEWIGLPDSINKNNFDICFDDLLELRKERTSELETQSFFLPVANAMHTDDGAHTTPFRYLPPLKQLNAGVAIQDIQCNEGKFLIHKRVTLSPACVSDKASNDLISPSYGWAKLRIGMPAETITQQKMCLWYPDVKLVQRNCSGFDLIEFEKYYLMNCVELAKDAIDETFVYSNNDIRNYVSDELTTCTIQEEDEVNSDSCDQLYKRFTKGGPYLYEKFKNLAEDKLRNCVDYKDLDDYEMRSPGFILHENPLYVPPPEPDTGEFRYGQEECHYTDKNGEQNFCVIEGWTKPASELDCEKICAPPGTKE